MDEVKIIVSGPVGCGKSALLGEIEILLKALGLEYRYENESAARSEKHLTHADWIASLEMYKPKVVLVEDMPWLREKAEAAARAQVERQAQDAVKVIQDLIDSHKRYTKGECDEMCDIVLGMEAARDAVAASGPSAQGRSEG